MTERTYNEAVWAGEFGDDYTSRNTFDPVEMDNIYLHRYGISRSTMNEEFLWGVDKQAKILEVGCNCGNQLLALSKAGFRDLTGVEINPSAAEIARRRVDATVYTGSALHLEHFNTNSYDLVFTCGVLIHIHPSDRLKVMDELVRVSNKFVWGFEYYSESEAEVQYRNTSGLLWKTDYAKLYRDNFGLTLIKEAKYVQRTDSQLTDHMFLLRKFPDERTHDADGL